MTYWVTKLHAICLPNVEVDKDEEAEKVDELIVYVDKFDTYNKARLLQSLMFFASKLKDEKSLGINEDSKDDKDQKNTTSEKKQDALTDDEKLIVESLESFRKAFRDTGVHLKHLAFFYGETTRKWKEEKRISTEADVANPIHYVTTVGIPWLYRHPVDVPVDTDRLIPRLFYSDHDDIEYSPIYAHPVFQDFLDLFPEHRKQWEEKPNVKVTWEQNGRKMSEERNLKVKKGGKGQTGEPSIKIARWMLKNLPTPTERMLKDMREQSVVNQSLET